MVKNIQSLNLEEIRSLLDKITSLDKRWDKIIKKIEQKYLFKDDFNLTRSLISIIRSHHSLSLIFNASPTNKKIREKLNNLIRLLTSLVNELTTLPQEIKAYLDMNILASLPDEIKIYADTHTNNMVQTVPETPYQYIQISKYLKDSEIALLLYKFLLFKTPIKKGGPKPKSTRKDLLCLLVDIFHEGTGKIPKCIHSGRNKQNTDIYIGEVYEFILDMEPLLEKLGLNGLGADYNLGKDINKIIKERSFLKKYETWALGA